MTDELKVGDVFKILQKDGLGDYLITITEIDVNRYNHVKVSYTSLDDPSITDSFFFRSNSFLELKAWVATYYGAEIVRNLDSPAFDVCHHTPIDTGFAFSYCSQCQTKMFLSKPEYKWVVA